LFLPAITLTQKGQFPSKTLNFPYQTGKLKAGIKSYRIHSGIPLAEDAPFTNCIVGRTLPLDEDAPFTDVVTAGSV
jgi:hypothetical protein